MSMLLLQPAVVVPGILVTQLRKFSVFLFSIVPQRNAVRMLQSGHVLFKHTNFKTLKDPESNYSMCSLLET